MGPLGGQKANFGPLVKTAGGASWAPGLPNGTPGGSKTAADPVGYVWDFSRCSFFGAPQRAHYLVIMPKIDQIYL